MKHRRIIAHSYFDGERHVSGGPFSINIDDGQIVSIVPFTGTPDAHDIVAPFVMPGLVEAHAHIVLDGSELDTEIRSA